MGIKVKTDVPNFIKKTSKTGHGLQSSAYLHN